MGGLGGEDGNPGAGGLDGTSPPVTVTDRGCRSCPRGSAGQPGPRGNPGQAVSFLS